MSALFEEIQKLESEIESSSDDQVAGWLSELLEIKRARIASEVLLVVAEPKKQIAFKCKECGKSIYSDEGTPPISFYIEGITDVDQCICWDCYQVDPEAFIEEYENLSDQLENGEFDMLPIPCEQCDELSMALNDDGTFICTKCGAGYSLKHDS